MNVRGVFVTDSSHIECYLFHVKVLLYTFMYTYTHKRHCVTQAYTCTSDMPIEL